MHDAPPGEGRGPPAGQILEHCAPPGEGWGHPAGQYFTYPSLCPKISFHLPDLCVSLLQFVLIESASGTLPLHAAADVLELSSDSFFVFAVTPTVRVVAHSCPICPLFCNEPPLDPPSTLSDREVVGRPKLGRERTLA